MTLAVCLAALVAAAAILAFNQVDPVGYTALTTDGVSYARGTVEGIAAEDLAPDSQGTGRNVGSQTLEVRIEDGALAGKTVRAANELTATHNVAVNAGSGVIVKVDAPEGLEPSYTIFNYDRLIPIAGILAVFAAGIVLVGGKKGAKSLLGLAWALFLILEFLLPGIYRGWSPAAVSVVTAVAITAVCMVLLNGASPKTYIATGSTAIGLLAAAVCFLAFSAALGVSGYNTDGADELIVIQQATGLDIGQALFACVLVSSLGAVMDMCMSVATGLFEMKVAQPDAGRGQIMRAGLSMGRDMVGTMCATLILAFAGTALMSLLLVISYGASPLQLLNSDYVAVELANSLAGAMAVIAAVPVTALLSSILLTGPSASAEEGPGE